MCLHWRDFPVGLFRRQPDGQRHTFRPRARCLHSPAAGGFGYAGVFSNVVYADTRPGRFASNDAGDLAFGGARQWAPGAVQTFIEINGVADDILPDADATFLAGTPSLVANAAYLASAPAPERPPRPWRLFIGLNDYNNFVPSDPTLVEERPRRWSSLSRSSRTGKRCLVSTASAGLPSPRLPRKLFYRR
jgi:hypothetical protein